MVDKDYWRLYGSQNQAASGGHWPAPARWVEFAG
jgi:hypothetical protein